MINIDIKNKEITLQISKGDYINRFDLINRMDFYNKSSFDINKLEIGNNKFENKGLLIEREWHVTIPYRLKVNDLYIQSSFKLNVQIKDKQLIENESKVVNSPTDVIETKTSESETINSPTDVIETKTSESETIDSPTDDIESETSESETIDSPTDVIETKTSESETIDYPIDVIEPETSESETIDSTTDDIETETSESETIDYPIDVIEPETSESETIDYPIDIIEPETSESEVVDSTIDDIEPETSESETVNYSTDVIEPEPKTSENEVIDSTIDDIEPETSENEVVNSTIDDIEPETSESEVVDKSPELDVLDDETEAKIVQDKPLNKQNITDDNEINKSMVTTSHTKRNIFIFCAIILVMILSILVWRSTSLNSIKTNVSQIESQQSLIKKELKQKTLTNEELSTLSKDLQKDQKMLNQLKSDNFWITQKRTELINKHNAINTTATDKAERNQ